MEERKLSRWEDLEAEISTLSKEVERIQTAKKMRLSGPLFRGHASASWSLKTTLERYTTRQYAVRDYYDVMRAARPTVESFTERSWNLSEEYNVDESIPGPPLGYEFMIYLRHHGFPSPLLDWTHSPYLAAFFAFQPKIGAENNHVAVYAYVEYSWTEIALNRDKARIVLLGPYVTTHKRHYTQQSWYTVCMKGLGDSWVYCNHEEVIKGDDNQRGFLKKYVIPGSERNRVLEKLHLMNINAYSLFGHEESLMETLAYQEIERKNP